MISRRLRYVLLLGLFSSSPTSFAATCDDLGSVSEVKGESGLSLYYQTSEVTPGQHFAMSVWVCEAGKPVTNIDRMRFDATMPAHGHGMNYRPGVSQISLGHYQIDGVLLHMPGHWQWRFDITRESQKQSILIDYHL